MFRFVYQILVVEIFLRPRVCVVEFSPTEQNFKRGSIKLSPPNRARGLVEVSPPEKSLTGRFVEVSPPKRGSVVKLSPPEKSSTRAGLAC